MVIIRILNFFIFFFLINIANNVLSSEIIDYETESYIKKINQEILSVNNYEKEINFKIIIDRNPNAFINQDNILFISSGLIIDSPDYVAFLGVLAHEIGHLEKYHISKRKESIQNLKSINTLGNLSIIAGSLISNNPEMMSALAVNQVGINNFYLGFSKDQEREADYYAIETLNKLSLSSNSIIKLLQILESNAINRGISEELQKFSTHPIFKERYQIITEKKIDKKNKFNEKLNDEFNFIKAKFLGYSEIEGTFSFKKYHQEYYESIKLSKSGNLLDSLRLLNKLILQFPDNVYLVETKADILISYGYKKEAVKFYKKVLDVIPDNNYAKLRIFLNLDIDSLNNNQKKQLFNEFINLLFDFPKSIKIQGKYNKLSYDLKKKNWIDYFSLVNNNKNLDKNIYNNKMEELMKKTNDTKLIKLIKKSKNI